MREDRVINVVRLINSGGFMFIGKFGEVATKYANITNIPPI